MAKAVKKKASKKITGNDKLAVNLAILEVVLYAIMIVSAKQGNYSLPKPWSECGLGVKTKIFDLRSLSAAMAYEGHRKTIISPASFTETNRPDHIFDGILCPEAITNHR